MTTRDIYQQLRLSHPMPYPSAVALELIRHCRRDDFSVSDIVRLIETDPGLSAKLLSYANSAMMGGYQPIVSIEKATIKIGINGVTGLALIFSLVGKYQQGVCAPFNYRRFWSKSLARAVAAKAIASQGAIHDPDDFFTCGLLGRIGELALASSHPREYAGLLNRATSDDDLKNTETFTFGLNHQQLTTELLSDWGLTEIYALAAGGHENCAGGSTGCDTLSELSQILYLALQIAELCLLEQPLSNQLNFIELFSEKLGVPAGGFPSFFDGIVADWQEWGRLLNISTQACPLYHQLKLREEISSAADLARTNATKLTILAVDDDPISLLSLSQMLSNRHRQVITAEDGEQALLIALDHRPEMIITDWRMPKIDGLELCKIIRRTSITKHIYIIMLTGCEQEDELVQAFDAGADDFVVKPFTPRVLEARIRSGERLARYQQTVQRDREVIQQYAAQLTAANRKLQTMAMTDSLTGLPNRRSAMVRIKDAVAEISRYLENLSCIMIDIDHFKQINDSHGHDNGDLVLREIARIFSSNARSYDLVSRIGGEEFLIICARSDLEEARQFAERLRLAVATERIRLNNGVLSQVTISCGVACWRDSYSDDEELIKAADQALYAAKQNGRNRVEVSAAPLSNLTVM